MKRTLYEIESQKIESVLPKLTYKIYDSNSDNILFLVENDEQISLYDKLLWTFSSNKFLPHGIESDDELMKERILVSKEIKENYQIIISLKRLEEENLTNFTQQFFIFNSINKDHFQQLSKAQLPHNKYFKLLNNNSWQEIAS